MPISVRNEKLIPKELKFGPDMKIRKYPHVLLPLKAFFIRIIQKALETTGKEQQLEIVEVPETSFSSFDQILLQKLETCIEDFVKDQNGNHVIQKCIEVVDPKHCQFILDAFKGKVRTNKQTNSVQLLFFSGICDGLPPLRLQGCSASSGTLHAGTGEE